MNKRITALLIAAAAMSVFCLAACGGDKNTNNTNATAKATTAAATTAATAAETTKAQETSDNGKDEQNTESDNGDGIPKEGDMYKGKKVGAVEKVPDCDDDKHGVIYIYDENEELIEAKKY